MKVATNNHSQQQHQKQDAKKEGHHEDDHKSSKKKSSVPPQTPVGSTTYPKIQEDKEAQDYIYDTNPDSEDVHADTP